MKASDRFYESVSAIANSNPELSLQSANSISKSAFRIFASHPKPAKELTAEDYDVMIAEATGNKFRCVASTFQPIELNNTYNVHYFSTIVEANTQVEEYNEEVVREKMKVITANIFEDNDSHLWKVVEANGKKMLVQTQAEDYDRIINSRIMARPSTMIASVNFHGIVPKNGDYATYYNADRMCLASGFALHVDGNIQIADRAINEWVTVSSEQIVESIAGSSLEEVHSPMTRLNKMLATVHDEPTEGDFTSKDSKDVLAYFRNLYSGTDYFSGLETLVAERRRAGLGNRPLTSIRY